MKLLKNNLTEEMIASNDEVETFEFFNSIAKILGSIFANETPTIYYSNADTNRWLEQSRKWLTNKKTITYLGKSGMQFLTKKKRKFYIKQIGKFYDFIYSYQKEGVFYEKVLDDCLLTLYVIAGNFYDSAIEDIDDLALVKTYFWLKQEFPRIVS
jgi:hypothetical protein